MNTKGQEALSVIVECTREKPSSIPEEVRLKGFEDLSFRLLLMNGPNLNMLGKRDPSQYGTFTLLDVQRVASETAFKRGFDLDCYQSNFEGALIEKIHEAMTRYDGIVINPGALTHYSYALRDAIELCGLPVVEAHISDIEKREDFRRRSVTAEVCIAQVKGLGIASYSEAIRILCDYIAGAISKDRNEPDEE